MRKVITIIAAVLAAYTVAMLVLLVAYTKDMPKQEVRVVEKYTLEYYNVLESRGYDSALAAYCDEYPDRDLGRLYVHSEDGTLTQMYTTCYSASQLGVIPDNGYLSQEDY
jgi:hypothetical protein